MTHISWPSLLSSSSFSFRIELNFSIDAKISYLNSTTLLNWLLNFFFIIVVVQYKYIDLLFFSFWPLILWLRFVSFQTKIQIVNKFIWFSILSWLCLQEKNYLVVISDRQIKFELNFLPFIQTMNFELNFSTNVKSFGHCLFLADKKRKT